ncbi:hypothetical protein QCD71_25305, partial [Sphingomonas sp. PsM26]|nr:hypothetical protein [Sphingomonas sp. PsM26]
MELGSAISHEALASFAWLASRVIPRGAGAVASHGVVALVSAVCHAPREMHFDRALVALRDAAAAVLAV